MVSDLAIHVQAISILLFSKGLQPRFGWMLGMVSGCSGSRIKGMSRRV